MEPITSLQNPRVKDLVRLRERRHRDRTSRFAIEGYREIGRAVEAGLALETIYTCPALFLGSNEQALIEAAVALGAGTVELAEGPFRKVSYRDRPEGLIATAAQFDTALSRLEADTPDRLFLVLESIEKPGNLGTMLRTADAAGVDGVVVCDPTTDPFNPNVVRASVGTLFTVRLAVASTDQTLEWARRHSIRTVATTPRTSKLYWEIDLRESVAVVIGTEQYGLSDRWLSGADDRIRIPMAGRSDSLNAAMAAGIVLFEAVRQRSTA